MLVELPLENFEKLKPALAMPAKNFTGVIDAVADRWATTSRTVHLAHREGVSHCAGVSAVRSSARAPRSAAMVVQMSVTAPSSAQPCWLLRACIKVLTQRGPTVFSAFAAIAIRGAICTGRVRAAVIIHSPASSDVNAGIPS